MARSSSGWKRSVIRNTAGDNKQHHALKQESDMNLSFQNKVALVTGAASGMGLVTAKAFAEAGAAVALSDVQENAVRSAAEELVAAGHKAIGIRCNVADEAEVAAMVAQTLSTFGRLDAAFNNAGVQSPAKELADVSGEEFERVNGINLRGVWNCMKYELRQMREQRSGAIVNNSSIGGLIGIAGRAAYHASKHGVIGLTKSAALEYASRGICINAVCPGTINTPMVADILAKEPDAMKDILKDQPIGRLGDRLCENSEKQTWSNHFSMTCESLLTTYVTSLEFSHSLASRRTSLLPFSGFAAPPQASSSATP